MKKTNLIISAIAVAALFASCEQELTQKENIIPSANGKYTLEFTATPQAVESKVTCENLKPAFETTDSLGVVIKGASAVDINLKAKTLEGKAAGKFTVTGATVADGTVYAYFPYNTFSDGGKSKGETDIWVSVKQNQSQSAINKMEAVNYMPFYGSAAIAEEMNLELKAIGSILALDIFDLSGAYTKEEIKSVIVSAKGASDAVLVGGYPTSLVDGTADTSKGGERKAGIVYLETPAAVSATEGGSIVYMAVLPGSHTLEITVQTTGGSHVFTFSAPVVSAAGKVGTVKLNLGNPSADHFVFRETFDLLIWGANYMYASENNFGYTPTGSQALKTVTGEEPYKVACTASGTDGCADYAGCTPELLKSRNLAGWTFSKAYEHPGFIKFGTSSGAFTVKLPKLTMLGENESLDLEFDYSRYFGTDGTLELTLEGAGQFTETSSATLSLNPASVEAAADVPAAVKHYKYAITGATSETVLKLSSTGTKPRVVMDNITIKRSVPADAETSEYIIYHGEKYGIKQMKDGNVWMTENLRYVPEGFAVSRSLSNVKAGVYYPVKLNAAGTAAEFATDAETIKANGFLYQSEVALGLQVNGITSEEQAKALEGAQGICPSGWHIPTSADILGLVGKAVSPLTTNTEAPYYDSAKANGTMDLLNADGFNAACWGAVSIIDNTKTAATLMGYIKAVPGKLGSGYVCGSSFAGITKNTDGSIKNIQFYGFMPMASAGTFNGSKLSYKIAASVRCVKNK